MQLESSLSVANPSLPPQESPVAEAELGASAPGEIRVIRRNGKVTYFDASKIGIAITKAFLAVEGGSAAASRRIHEVVEDLTAQVVTALFRRNPSGGTIHIEDIQDQVELALMRGEHHKVARAYVLYREEHARHRAEQAAQQPPAETVLHVTLADGSRRPLDSARLQAVVAEACRDLADVDGGWILEETRRNLFDGVPEKDVAAALLMSARTRIEQEPNYTYVTARLLLDTLRREALSFLGHGRVDATQDQMAERYAEYFAAFIKRGAELELLSSELTRYDLKRLGAAIKPERDLQFTYLGLQTLYDRYFIHHGNVRFELPQAFFMRVAMGLAMNEVDRETRTIEFYNLLSSFDFMSSTPTLFNAGTLRPQLSSCYLTTVPDDLEGIYSAIKDNALLSKYAGGLGNDWTPVRGLGAHIKGTNGKSQGVVPFLKVANDTAVAVNQSFVPGTLLPTNKGIMPIEEITEEHLLLNLFGEFKQVGILKSYNQHDPVVKITTHRCLEPFRVTAGHPIAVIRGIKERESYKRISWSKKLIEWVEAKDLLPTDMIVSRIPEHNFNPWRVTRADARMYGIMVGDGHVKSGRNEAGVSLNINTNERTIDFVVEYLTQANVHYWTIQDRNCLYINWKASDLPLFSRSTLYDDKKDKIIVGEMLHLPKQWAIELLCGLLETDGYKKKSGGFGYVTKSRKLAEAVRFVATKFKVLPTGYRRSIELAKFTKRDGSIIVKDNCADVFEVHIPAFDELARRFGVNVFEIHQGWYTFQDHYLLDRVVSIENDGYRGMVYDFEMQGQPSYAIANGVVHNGGKRLGAVCAYLETWHLDIEEFLDLRKNTGDDRRRTHDMNTANWVPDLFMKRVAEDGQWTLFSPSDTPDLHDLTGLEFERRYTEYEAKADRGDISLFKRLPAAQLWRKMLSMLFETGHPWITFKDPCNLRYTNRQAGMVHSSNLCCIAADQRVVTDRGLLTIGELYRLGGKNKVVGLDGIYDASEMLLPRPNAPMVRIETQEGYTHKVTPDHKVWVKDRGWVEAQDLAPGDKLLIQQLEGLWGHQHNPELAYLMGLIAGDGTFGKHNVFIDVWEQDFSCISRTTEIVHQVLEGNTVLNTTSVNTPVFRIDPNSKKARLASAPLRRVLAEQGFTPDTKTRLPELIWRGDRETASAYLKGLYQADGNVVASGEVTTLALASTDLEFIRELQILWANFGVKSSINQMRGHTLHDLPDGKGGKKAYWSQPLYRLLITSIQGCKIAESVTQLAAARKSAAAAQYLENLKKSGYQQKLYATFAGLTTLPNEDAYCLMVNSETHAWTVNGMVTKNTEITLHTNDQEIAVCNLGSINLAAHITADGDLDSAKLEKTISTAMRMLDNVIDINYYSVPQARRSNLRHRPVGLGIMGFQDALYKQGIPYSSEQAVTFADRGMELVSYYTIKASTDLAEERGRYSTFEGSLWSRGILPIDSIALLEEGRGGFLQMDRSTTLDWDSLRERVKTVGMRNSNTMAIAPTATISNICGVSQSIEPTYQNLFVKSNLSGEFTVVNPYLVAELKRHGLWDAVMINDLKYYDGSVQKIERVPEELKRLYATAFELDPRWLIEAGSRRQKWIDQAQSLNLYMAEPSGKKLDNLYKLAWVRGLKTTYYLRTLGATHVEKSTAFDGKLNAVRNEADAESAPKMCLIDDPTCEACQ